MSMPAGGLGSTRSEKSRAPSRVAENENALSTEKVSVCHVFSPGGGGRRRAWGWVAMRGAPSTTLLGRCVSRCHFSSTARLTKGLHRERLYRLAIAPQADCSIGSQEEVVAVAVPKGCVGVRRPRAREESRIEAFLHNFSTPRSMLERTSCYCRPQQCPVETTGRCGVEEGRWREESTLALPWPLVPPLRVKWTTKAEPGDSQRLAQYI